MKRIRVVLADDHRAVRNGLLGTLEAETDIEVVGAASDGPGALELIHQTRPDVAILDIMMPGLTGLEVAERLTAESCETGVVILSLYHDETYVLEALRCGASGYCVKQNCAGEIADAVRVVASGGMYLGDSLSARIRHAFEQAAAGE